MGIHTLQAVSEDKVAVHFVDSCIEHVRLDRTSDIMKYYPSRHLSAISYEITQNAPPCGRG
jgi:hypothetical protein